MGGTPDIRPHRRPAAIQTDRESRRRHRDHGVKSLQFAQNLESKARWDTGRCGLRYGTHSALARDTAPSSASQLVTVGLAADRARLPSTNT
jgi:hypothetical protein